MLEFQVPYWMTDVIPAAPAPPIAGGFLALPAPVALLPPAAPPELVELSPPGWPCLIWNPG